MPLDIERRGGDQADTPETSRILLPKDVATAFRKLCKHAGKEPSVVLHEMMARYIKSEKLPIRLVKR